MKKNTEHFLSIVADFAELQICALNRDEVHAVSALHGTRLHLHCPASFQVSVTRRGSKPKIYLSRERRARGLQFPMLRTGDLPK